MSRYFGLPPSIIEIHPGTRSKRPFTDIIEASRLLVDTFREMDGLEPLILVENRTGQQISSGREIRDFWSLLTREHLDLKNKIGIVLDIQQLYTQNSKNLKTRSKEISGRVLSTSFEQDLDSIPQEGLKGFHIHRLHGVPHIPNEIPWRLVFDRIVSINDHIIINPEIHHANDVKKAIDFCDSMLHHQQNCAFYGTEIMKS